MLIKAKYDGEPCYLNVDYVVDVFVEKDGTIHAYTLDADRHGYEIDDKDFKRMVKKL